MNFNRIRETAAENKAWIALTILLLIMVLGLAGLFLDAKTSDLSALGDYRTESLSASRDIPGPGGGDSGSYVEVQEADIDVDTENAKVDAERVRSKANSSDGYIESSSKRTTERYIRYDITARVPSERLDDFVSELRNDFDVNSYSVENYRLYTQRERDELDILNETLGDYSDIRDEVKQMDNTGEKLDLLMQITEKELEAKEKQGRYERQLSDKEKRGEYSTVEIRIEEQKEVEFIPEDLGEKFREEASEMFEKVLTTLVDTVTGAVEVFFLAIKYLVFLAVIALPVGFAYRTGKWVYERFK